MKKQLMTWLLLACTPAAYSQMISNVGLGLNSKTMGPMVQIEQGARIGGKLYAGAGVQWFHHGHPTLQVHATAGLAHSWNNKHMHDLTTIFFARIETPVLAHKSFVKHPPFAGGFRHYVYNAYVEAAYSPNQITFTVGYSFGKIFK